MLEQNKQEFFQTWIYKEGNKKKIYEKSILGSTYWYVCKAFKKRL